MPPLDESAQTRQRLLDAAVEVFSQHGFHKATVREICEKAAANVASINYYFRDKEALYAEVLKCTHHQSTKERPISIDPNASKEEQLRGFINGFLHQILSEGQQTCHGRLMAMEMIEPTGALDRLVEEEIRPMANGLGIIVRNYLGPDFSKKAGLLAGHSIVGQILHYHHSRPVVERLHPEIGYQPKDIEEIAEHIFEFSNSALQQMAKRKSRKPS